MTANDAATDTVWVRQTEGRSEGTPVSPDSTSTALMGNLTKFRSSARPKSTGQAPSGRDESPPVGRVLRQARKHLRLSLREVERRIGRSNAYLSQVERGLIKQPDPVVLLELAELYRLNFMTLATWAGWAAAEGEPERDMHRGDSKSVLVRRVLELDDTQRAQVLAYIESLLRERRT